MRRTSGGREAFTLIEILCVCIILAIAASVAIPYVQNGYYDVKLSAGGRALMADIYYAQNLAISTQQNVYVILTPASSTTNGYYTIRRGATLATSTVVKHPVDGRDYIQYLGSAPTGQIVRSGFTECKLGTLATGFTGVGFSFLGEPLKPSDNSQYSAAVSIPLLSLRGNLRITLEIEPYTGEMTTSAVTQP